MFLSIYPDQILSTFEQHTYLVVYCSSANLSDLTKELKTGANEKYTESFIEAAKALQRSDRRRQQTSTSTATTSDPLTAAESFQKLQISADSSFQQTSQEYRGGPPQDSSGNSSKFSEYLQNITSTPCPPNEVVLREVGHAVDLTMTQLRRRSGTMSSQRSKSSRMPKQGRRRSISRYSMQRKL
jgi:hypothetical protein